MKTEQSALLNRRILVTRPNHQSATLCQLIEHAGGIPLRLPVLAIAAPADIAHARMQLQRLSGCDMGIFISRNAVDKTVELLQPESLPTNIPWLAIGQATAAALQQHGYRVSLMPDRDFSSEGLLALPALQNVRGKRIAIIRGAGGRELLAGVLNARGATIEYIETYRRIRPEVPAAVIDNIFSEQAPELVVTTSTLVLENLLQIIGTDYHRRINACPLVVLSSRARKYALEQGFTRVYIAPHSDDKGIVTALTHAVVEGL